MVVGGFTSFHILVTTHKSTSQQSQEKMFLRAKRDFSEAKRMNERRHLHETKDFLKVYGSRCYQFIQQFN